MQGQAWQAASGRESVAFVFLAFAGNLGSWWPEGHKLTGATMKANYLLRCICVVAIVLSLQDTSSAQGPPRGPQFRHGDDDLPRLAEPPEFQPPSSPSPPSLLPNSMPGPADENRVWKCSKCGAVLGRGAVEPKIERCPTCGAKLTNWFNYYVIGGVGGALMAGLVLLRILVRAMHRPTLQHHESLGRSP
jgi:DNA-directed RNA polymerase subunit RPC12/RpoP